MTPLVSACLIVKNEERFLPGCLSSLREVADEVVIVDTGSSDRTVEIARDFGARVSSFAWCDDFAAARNASLAPATGRFILYVDADEEVMAEDRRTLRETLESDAYDALLMRIVSPLHGTDKASVDVYPRVFRRYPDVRFQYRIHEQIWPSLSRHAPRVQDSALRILHHGYAQSPEVLDQKRRRNLDTALAVLEEEPDNAYYLYHAGFSNLTLGRREPAIGYLERALRLTPAGQPRVPILNALAQAHHDARDDDRALAFVEESTALCPEQFHGWGLAIDILLQHGRHEQAIVALRRALAVSTSRLASDVTASRPVMRLKLGLSLLLTRRPNEAIAALDEALAGDLPVEFHATAERYRTLAARMQSGAP